MSSSPGRAQTEPLAALVAVFALGVGLSLYAGALDATLPALTTDREMATRAASGSVCALPGEDDIDLPPANPPDDESVGRGPPRSAVARGGRGTPKRRRRVECACRRRPV